MSDTEKPKPEQDATTGRFVSGNIGGGRKKGSRAKIGEAFINDMYEAWTTMGADVISRVIKEDPAAFLRSMVSILPKELDVNINKYDSMTDEQLRAQFLAALRDAQSLGIDIGSGKSASADQAPQDQPPKPVSPLH